MMSLLFLCAAAVAIDGDTLRCANIHDANGRVRLARIDAPELRQEGGEEARAMLAAMLSGPVRCEHVDADPRTEVFEARDRFGRIVARCFVGQRDIGEAMLEAGLAKRWPR